MTPKELKKYRREALKSLDEYVKTIKKEDSDFVLISVNPKGIDELSNIYISYYKSGLLSGRSKQFDYMYIEGRQTPEQLINTQRSLMEELIIRFKREEELCQKKQK